jgi:uncharacterized protein
VIGLNLCPFAKSVHAKEQIRFSVTGATNADELIEELVQELTLLDRADPAVINTTLLIHPLAMTDFLQYNDFLDTVDLVLEDMTLDGVLQVANFHPHYQFADSAADDIENFSNRSPYPTLHILREESVSQAVLAFPDAQSIYGENMKTLRNLGRAGWDALWARNLI